MFPDLLVAERIHWTTLQKKVLKEVHIQHSETRDLIRLMDINDTDTLVYYTLHWLTDMYRRVCTGYSHVYPDLTQLRHAGCSSLH